MTWNVKIIAKCLIIPNQILGACENAMKYSETSPENFQVFYWYIF